MYKKILKISVYLLIYLALTSSVYASSSNVSINVRDTDIRTVLTSLGSLANANIILDDSVKGKISINLSDIPFEQALDMITKSKGLGFQKANDTYIITSSDIINKNFSKINIIKIYNTSAADLKSVMSNMLPANNFTIDPLTNSVVFVGNTQQEEAMRDTIKKLDIVVKQISLEAKLIAVNHEHSKDFGVNWQWSQLPAHADSKSSLTGTIKFGRNYEFNYSSTLNALIKNGMANVLATPKITTLPGKEAIIFIGDKIPVQTERTENATTTQSTTYVDAGIKLKYTAQITADDTITATVHTEVSTPTLVPELKHYKISTRRADTNVRLKNGETLIIAGLIGEEERKNITKIPFLGDLPIIGALFRSTSTGKSKTEVMVFLTPHIVE